MTYNVILTKITKTIDGQILTDDTITFAMNARNESEIWKQLNDGETFDLENVTNISVKPANQ